MSGALSACGARQGRLAYSASKWGLRGVTKSFALEVGPFNINVNYVAPGMVDGPLPRKSVPHDGQKARHHRREAAVRHAAAYALKAHLARYRRRQRLPVSRQRRLATDHRRRHSGRRRLGVAVRK